MLQAIGAAAWPKCGGANGSIRFDPEIAHGANAGLKNALALLEPVKEKFPEIGYADLFQLASATAVEVCVHAQAKWPLECSQVVAPNELLRCLGCEVCTCMQVMGGPKIPMKYGRKDATGPEMCHPEGNLPAGNAPFPSGGDAAGHLRAVFHRMGLSDQDIVALSGAHTVGRAHASRSGACTMPESKYTAVGACPMGTAVTGGQSWTPEWIKFDNSYFSLVQAKADADLLVLETDGVIFTDPEFKCASSLSCVCRSRRWWGASFP